MTHVKFELTALEQVVKVTLEEWAGWPEPEWLIGHIARKHKRSTDDVSAALKSLFDKGIIAKEQHGAQVVFRMNHWGT